MEKGKITNEIFTIRVIHIPGAYFSMPDLDTDDERLYTIPGSPPNLLHEKPGDAFAPVTSMPWRSMIS